MSLDDKKRTMDANTLYELADGAINAMVALEDDKRVGIVEARATLSQTAATYLVGAALLEQLVKLTTAMRR